MAKPLATTAALALIAGLGLSSFAFAQTTTTTEVPATPATPVVIDPATIADYGIGNIDAKVKIVEYLSFTCPHCADFHA